MGQEFTEDETLAIVTIRNMVSRTFVGQYFTKHHWAMSREHHCRHSKSVASVNMRIYTPHQLYQCAVEVPFILRGIFMTTFHLNSSR